MAVSTRPLEKRRCGCYNGSIFCSNNTPIQIDISVPNLSTDEDVSGSFTDADVHGYGEEAAYDVYEGGEQVGNVPFEQSQQTPFTNVLGDLFDSMIQECIEEAAGGEIDTGDQGSSISSMQ